MNFRIGFGHADSLRPGFEEDIESAGGKVVFWSQNEGQITQVDFEDIGLAFADEDYPEGVIPNEDRPSSTI